MGVCGSASHRARCSNEGCCAAGPLAVISPTNRKSRRPTFGGAGRFNGSKRNEAVHSLLDAAGGAVAAPMSEMHAAAKKGDLQHLAQMVSTPGANLEVTDCLNATPLHYAVREGQEKAAAALIQAGASLAARDADGCLPLHSAATTGHPEAIRLLLHARSDTCAVDHQGNTALHLAAARVWGGDDVGRLLMDAKAEVNLKNVNGYTPLACADDWGSRAFTDILRECGGIR
mmetsp:Transcript_100907/g.200448  ORF Transcript_100907/g.200448 Transcript_100907/m.200448 type:complete len:230 (-) Transcript_100907:257-946(-)